MRTFNLDTENRGPELKIVSGLQPPCEAADISAEIPKGEAAVAADVEPLPTESRWIFVARIERREVPPSVPAAKPAGSVNPKMAP